MSIFISKEGFNVQSSIQRALESKGALPRSGALFLAFGKSLANIVAAPLHNLALAFKEANSFNHKKVFTHLSKCVTSAVNSLYLSVILLVTALASTLFGKKAIGLIFDGQKEFHLKKYQVILEEYRASLEVSHKKTLDEIISDVVCSTEEDKRIKNALLNSLHCLKPDENSDKNARDLYIEFVENLDIAAARILARQSAPSDNFCVSLAETLALNRWAGVHMKKHFAQRVKEAAPSLEMPGSLKDLPNCLRETNKAIAQADCSTRKSWVSLQYQKFRGAIGIENFTGKKNTPNVLAQLSYGKQNISYLRHGSPTFGKDVTLRNNSEKIVANYELFLKAAKRKNQGVFYVIHQRNFGAGLGDERGRTHAILKLEDKHDNFHAMVQPVEGDFFNKPVETTSINDIKAELIYEFFEKKDHPTCVLPKVIKNDPEYKTTFEKLLQSTQEIFFQNRTEINSKERKNFILFFYALQRMELKTRLGKDTCPISYYVTACKDNLDRGGAQALLELVIHSIITKKTEDQDQLKDIVNNILGAPIIVKQKEMISSRLNPIIEAIEHIIKTPGILENLSSYEFGRYAPTDITFN